MKYNLRSFALWWGGGLVFLIAILLPVLRQDLFAQPLFASDAVKLWMKALLCALPPLAVYALFRKSEAERRNWLIPALVCLAGALLAEHVHHQFVDKAFYLGGPPRNDELQLSLHREVLNLNPRVLPHCYRFLSCSIVAIFQWLCGEFYFAQHAYRILFYSILFSMVYKLARLYVERFSATLAVLFLLVLYPVTIAWYMGQSLDPVSHLSFVVCCYLFARGNDLAVIPTLVLGVLAKESVAAEALGRIFFGKQRLRAWVLAAIYTAISLIIVVGIRLWITRNNFAYNKISGVGPSQIISNLRDWEKTIPQLFFSVGVLLPGAVLGWRLVPRGFALNAAYITFCLVVSNAFISWLNEVRNLMPAMILLMIMNVKYLECRFIKNPAQAPQANKLFPFQETSAPRDLITGAPREIPR